MTERDSFASMGCDVVVAGATASERLAIRELFARRDAVFSRFRPDSELNRVNRARGRHVRVSALFAEMVRMAIVAARATGGLVDPTLGRAVREAGYSADFALLEPDPRPAPAGDPGRWREVRVIGQLLERPAGLELDLNGVVKAIAVDDALALLSRRGFVSAGGDIAASGPHDVSVPRGSAVRLVEGALATSGSGRRRWLRAGRVEHHLIDPQTGRPADSPWEQVTVAGKTCLAADVAAKAAFLLGEDGPGWLDARGLPGRFVTQQGDEVLSDAWRRSLEKEPACI